MRILVIGCGSHGAARARLVSDLGHVPFLADLNNRLAERLHEEMTLAGKTCGWVQFDRRHSFGAGAFDAALICTPIDTRMALAHACLNGGVRAILIEQPIASVSQSAHALSVAAEQNIVMVGCGLRFACDLPSYLWAMLSIQNSGALCGHGSVLRTLNSQVDLAYAINGPIRGVRLADGPGTLIVVLEHRNFASTEITFDRSSRLSEQLHVAVSAYDDGRSIQVPHEPIIVGLSTAERARRREMFHFLTCAQTQTTPCNNVSDAIHVLSWTTRAAQLLGPSCRALRAT